MLFFLRIATLMFPISRRREKELKKLKEQPAILGEGLREKEVIVGVGRINLAIPDSTKHNNYVMGDSVDTTCIHKS